MYQHRIEEEFSSVTILQVLAFHENIHIMFLCINVIHTHKSSDEATAVDLSEDLCVHSTVEFTPTVYTEHL